jgi:hypothetical protein
VGDHEPVLSSFGNALPGETITFGAYPHSASGADNTAVEWRVLQNSGRELLLLSEYLLDCQRYHADFVDITWRDCDLRRWLNDNFYKAAFTAAEKRFIKTAHCSDNGAASPDTDDNVFLLSVAELKKATEMLGKEIRRALGTEFARVNKADGCHLYVYDKSVGDNYVTRNGRTFGCSWWWLRTQLGSPSRATFVGTRASIRSYGRVNLAYYGVRPALRLKLQPD